MRKLLASVSFAALLVGAFSVPFWPMAVNADDGAKNLKILPKDMSKADIKKLMKSIASALGVECEHCHNTDNFAEDGEKKEEARAMMRMTGDINKNFFKGKN